MPYPPPPGPPDVGEFQAIGKLPAPNLPDVTGHGGEFLETDGIIPQWEPVSGVLPDQTGHGGEFLTTDGATASWAVVPSTLPSQTGHAGEFLTTDGATPSWAAVLSPYDVEAFGAVPDDTTVDSAQAFYNVIASWSQSAIPLFPIIFNVPAVGGVDWGRGTYYGSMPLCTPSGGVYAGVDPNVTRIVPGIGDGLGVDIPSFAGPIFYGAPAYTPSQLPSANFPTYDTPLVGVTGQSLVLHDNTNANLYSTSTYWLHDAWPWGGWLETVNVQAFSLQFWVVVDETPANNLNRGIIGSRGPTGTWAASRPTNPTDIAFGVYCTSNGANLYLQAFLTTNAAFNGPVNFQASGTLHSITSSAITAGTPINVEMDYDGSFFDFYVDGVNQGHVSATGGIVKAGWEGVGIGGQGMETLDLPAAVSGINGKIDSIRLSKVARHTGVGGFTPPAAKYTWDSDTYALYNWDQGVQTVQPKHPDGSNNGPLLTLPFLVGQSVAGNASQGMPITSLVGPVKHFIRLFSANVSTNNIYRDFTVNGWGGASGIVTANAWRCDFERIWTTQTTRYGIRIGTSVSFFNKVSNCKFYFAAGTGLQLFGAANNCEGAGASIAVHITNGGSLDHYDYQPNYYNYCSYLLEGANGAGSTFECTWLSNDAEVFTFARQIGLAAIIGAVGQVHFRNNLWQAIGSSNPIIEMLTMPNEGAVTFLNDFFVPNRAGQQGAQAPTCSMVHWGGSGTPPNNILAINCTVEDSNRPKLPISNIDGWVGRWNGTGTTNQQSLSTGEVQAANLDGTFDIQGGFTEGGPFFARQEPDTNYTVQITPLGYSGVAPAAGSNRITFPLQLRTDGFSAPVEVDPGVGSTVTFAWQLTRTEPGPLLFEPIITPLPQTYTNPLDGQVDGFFAVGITVRPASGNVFVRNQLQAFESIVSAGTTPAGTDSWEIGLDEANGLPFFAWNGTVAVQPGASVVNGKLVNILSPGAHNLGLVLAGGQSGLYIDGQFIAGTNATIGAQQTPVYVGERSDTTAPLTTGTVGNLKLDRRRTVIISNDNDIGPGTQDQGAFFGDSWILGVASTSASGGFASQIADGQYGTTYYHMACLSPGQLTAGGGLDLVSYLWKPWLGVATAPTLVNCTIMAGWQDIITGATATDCWAQLLKVLEGSAAFGIWSPPTSTTSPTQQHAYAVWAPGTVSCTCVVSGHSFTSIAGTQTAIVNDMIAQIAAHGPTAALVTGQLQTEPSGQVDMVLLAVAPGTAGNGIVVSTDGAGGATCFGDVGGGFPGNALSVQTIAGVDTTCIIAGVSFIANFDTDAATTVNNLVSLVNADPTVSPLVTASNVSNQMYVVANSAGYGGNSITVGGNPANTPLGGFPTAWSTFPSETLTGGFNGAVTSAIPNILLCNVPPIGTVPGVTGPMQTELAALNVLINAYVGAGVSIVDVNTTLADPGTPTNLLPAYDAGNGTLNDAGHTALFGLINPLLP